MTAGSKITFFLVVCLAVPLVGYWRTSCETQPSNSLNSELKANRYQVKPSTQDEFGLTEIEESTKSKSPPDDAFNEDYATPISFLDSVFGTLSLRPDSPLEVYSRYIDLAKKGNPVAMYWVALAFDNCGGNRIPDATEADPLYTLSFPNKELVLAVEQARVVCSPFFEAFPNLDFREESKKWMDGAVESGNAVAILERKLTKFPRAPDFELERFVPELIETVKKANKYGYPAYYLVSDFLSEHNFEHNINSVSREAWALLACQKHPACRGPQHILALEEEFYPYQVDDIIKHAAIYEKKIQDGTLDKLESDSSVVLN